MVLASPIPWTVPGTRYITYIYVFTYWGLTPQQQLGSYRGGDDHDEMSVSLVEENGVPGGNHRPMARNGQTFIHMACVQS